MRRTGLLIVKNVLEQARDIKRNSLFFFLPIAIFICLFTYFNVNEIELNFIQPLKVGVVVEDNTFYTQMLVDDFESKKDLSRFFQLEQGDMDTITRRFNAKELDGMLIIPEGFFEAVLYFDENPMEVKIHSDDPIAATILYNGFLAYEQYIISVEKAINAFYDSFRDEVSREEYWEYNDALSIDLIMTMLNRNDLYTFNEIIEIPSASSMEYYFVAMTVMFVFLMAMFTATQWIKERHTDVFMRMTLTNIKSYEYILSRWIGDFIFISLIVTVWSLAFQVSGESGASGGLRGALYHGLLIMTAIALASIVTLVLNEESDMVLVSSMVVFFGSVLGGSIIPIHYLPEGLKVISGFTPNYLAIRHILFLRSGLEYDGGWIMITGMVMVIILSFFALDYHYRERIRRGSHG